jgi:hypothetical protein
VERTFTSAPFRIARLDRAGSLADALTVQMGHWLPCRRVGSTQLTITVNGRASREDVRTILWHGPRQGVGENYSDSDQTVLELLNRFGADGWELAGIQDYREGGEGSSYWDAALLLTVYTFKHRLS